MESVEKKQRFLFPGMGIIFFVAAVAVLVGISFVMTESDGGDGYMLIRVHPVGIMGTSCELSVWVKREDETHGRRLLAEAEQELRACEILTSTWMENSEVSRFNRAEAGERIAFSPFTEAFFIRSRQAWEETGGIFDITCGGVWKLWQDAEKKGQEPSEEEIFVARKESLWEMIRLEPGFAVKTANSVQIVTGGIAKGMAIDRAMECLRKDEKVLAAAVDVGGDVSVFRREGCKLPVMVKIKNPRENAGFSFVAETGGICTSGNYARFFRFGEKRYSQILDPRTGRPADEIISVTVTGPDATTADIWSTVMAVLGEEGERMLPEGVKVLDIIR